MRRWVLGAVLVATGCAGRGGSSSRFPAPAKVDRIALDPLPPGDPPEVADVAEWIAKGPFPSKHGSEPRRELDKWDALLGDRPKSEAARCVARELARFRVKHRASPSEDLERWLAARCGTAAAGVVSSYQETEVPLYVGEDVLLEGAADGVKRVADEILAESPQAELGVAFAREETRAGIVVVALKKMAQIDPVPFAPEGGGVRIQGTLQEPAEWIYAIATRGAVGTVECDRDPAAQPPRFSLTCPVDATDREVRIDVLAAPQRRLLAYRVASFVIFPGKPVDRWSRLSLPAAKGEAGPAILASVNEIRKSAGLRPARMATAQTDVTSRIAPHWFASVWGTANHREEMADVIALGLMAGWRVDGDVISGRLTSSWVPHSGDPARLVASALEWPAGRTVLLDPEIDALAIGTVSGGKRPVLAAVIAGYALREKEEQESLLQAIETKLEKPGARLVGFDAKALAAAAKVEKGKDPHAVLRSLMADVSTKTQRGVRGWVIETSDLRELVPPPEMKDTTKWVGAVAWRRPAGEPWGRYVVLLVAPD